MRTMLLDDLMPRYDVAERHATVVRATPAATLAAIRTADLAGGAVTGTLLALRGFGRRPAAIGRGLAPFERAGFRVVAERPGEEIVIGLAGRFWTPRGGLCADVSAETFAGGPPPGMALAGWNFTVAPYGRERCELRTETRVWCAPDARMKFRAYWLLVRPGSGVIRRMMLRAIRLEAEAVKPRSEPPLAAPADTA